MSKKRKDCRDIGTYLVPYKRRKEQPFPYTFVLDAKKKNRLNYSTEILREGNCFWEYCKQFQIFILARLATSNWSALTILWQKLFRVKVTFPECVPRISASLLITFQFEALVVLLLDSAQKSLQGKYIPQPPLKGLRVQSARLKIWIEQVICGLWNLFKTDKM